MPVDTRHKMYTGNKPRWEIVRNCIDGEGAVKSAGETYLPRLTGQTLEEYKKYLWKAEFFGATGRAADGLHGDVFSKPPQQSGQVPDVFNELIDDVDLMGTSIDQFASDLVWDNMQTNWGGILVDYSKGADKITMAQAEKEGYKAYLKWYPAERLINWKYAKKDGKQQLVMVTLEEPYTEQDPEDRFSEKEFCKYRVLEFDEQGNYIQTIYDSKSDIEVPSETITPIIRGKPMKVIPFFSCPGKLPEKSMLLDLAYQNIHHYNQSADYENGKHYTSVPTPVALGVRPEIDENGNPKPVSIGGTRFLFFNNDNGGPIEIKYLEFTGSGIDALHKGMQAAEERMAVLGAHIITGEKKGVETAEAARIHRAGENGVLGAFIRNISTQLTRAIRLKAVWDGIDENIMDGWSYALNTDYDMRREDAQLLSVVLNGRQSGEIPRVSLYKSLKNIELIPEDWDFDTFLEETEKDIPATAVVDVRNEPD